MTQPAPNTPRDDEAWERERFCLGIVDHPDGSCITEEAADELAAHLGLHAGVVYALEIAWQDDAAGGCWLFPETDCAGRTVGKTYRYRDGRTGAVPGGRRGLTAPDEWDLGGGPLLLPVGVSDTLALTALDLPALGRPGDAEGLDELAECLGPLPPERRLILFAKGEGRGGAAAAAEESARRAAAELTARLGRPVAWALPPDGAHDLRAWAVSRLAHDADHAAWVELGRQLLVRLRPQAAPPVAVVRGMKAADLLRRELPAAAWVMEGLLPEGVTILAGKPKGGKSWLALQLALAVAGGSPLPGAGAVSGGEVLYLALEDTERRLKGRLQQMLADRAGLAPAGLSVVTSWRGLEEGGQDDLVAWLSSHAGTRLVVIDTLAMLRSRRRGAAYQDDYHTIAAFRRLAARFGLAVLVVHHVRKLPAHDPFDAVSGTLGLTGATDTVWVLTRVRGEVEAVLHVTGKDVEERELALGWDAPAARWTLLGPAADHWRGKEQARVLDLLTRAGRPLRPRDVAPLLEKKEGTTRVLLWRMAEKGLLVSEGGAYTVATRAEDGLGDRPSGESDAAPGGECLRGKERSLGRAREEAETAARCEGMPGKESA